MGCWAPAPKRSLKAPAGPLGVEVLTPAATAVLKAPAGSLGIAVATPAATAVLKAPAGSTRGARCAPHSVAVLASPAFVEPAAPFSPPRRVGHTPPQPTALLAPSALTGRFAPRSSSRRPRSARSPGRCGAHPSRVPARGPRGARAHSRARVTRNPRSHPRNHPTARNLSLELLVCERAKIVFQSGRAFPEPRGAVEFGVLDAE